MSRRIEVELTSARDDGSWTWRAAGAREPRGVVESELLPPAAKVGDVLRVEADFDVDGITIISVVPAKGERREPERLELLGRGGDFEPVTSTLVARRERGDRPPRRDRPEGDRPRSDRDRRDRPGGPRSDRPAGGDRGRGDRRPGGNGTVTTGTEDPGRSERGRTDRSRPDRSARPAAGSERGPRPDRPPRAERAAPPSKPRPTRLRPSRTHRNEFVRNLPAERQPIAEQAMRGGLPAVRQALEEQNAKLRAEDKPEIKPDGVLSVAEQLLPALRVAEWLDRAEAARAVIDELELGDLRSVVVAADDAAVAREETTRELAAELKAALVRRQDESHHEWLSELTEALDGGRSVRALRLSSRPPKAGAVFPPELRTRLAQAATASLTPDAAADRWVAVLEALAYSPVHGQVTVDQPPSTANDDLRATVARLAGLLPDIARAFGVEPPPPGSRAPRPRRSDQRRPRSGTAPLRPAPPPAPKATAPTSTRDAAARTTAEPTTAEPAEAARPGVSESQATETRSTTPPTEPAGVEPADTERAGVEPADTESADTKTAGTEPAAIESEGTGPTAEPSEAASTAATTPSEAGEPRVGEAAGAHTPEPSEPETITGWPEAVTTEGPQLGDPADEASSVQAEVAEAEPFATPGGAPAPADDDR